MKVDEGHLRLSFVVHENQNKRTDAPYKYCPGVAVSGTICADAETSDLRLNRVFGQLIVRYSLISAKR